MKIYITTALVLCTMFSFGQNTMRFSQFNFAQGINNPAAIAIDGKIMADLIYRNQWFGVDGAPNSAGLNAQYEFDGNSSAGLNVYYDQIGLNKTTSFSLQGSYKLFVNRKKFVAFGLALGGDNEVRDLQAAKLNDPEDPSFAMSYSKFFINGGFGVFYKSPIFYVGFSLPKLMQTSAFGRESKLAPKRWHYYTTLGWFVVNRNRKYMFNPHIQLKAVPNAPIQADVILRNSFLNTFSITVGYNTENAVIAGVDFKFASRVRIGYSFSHSVGQLSKYQGSINELYLGVGLPYHNKRDEKTRRQVLTKQGSWRLDYNSKTRVKRRGRIR